MKTYSGSRGLAPLIHYFGTGWIWAVTSTPRPIFSQERTSPVPTE